MFKKLEIADNGTIVDLNIVLENLKWDSNGLIPAIAQQEATGEILMLAYMNREALEETLQSGRVCYWSRSRKALWRKGETSGHTQTLKEMRVDCDGDTLLLKVEQIGPACHTERANCFYNQLNSESLIVDFEES